MKAPAILCQACVEIVSGWFPYVEIRSYSGAKVTPSDLQAMSRDPDPYQETTFTASPKNTVGIFAICLVDGHWVCAWHTRNYDKDRCLDGSSLSRGWVR